MKNLWGMKEGLSDNQAEDEHGSQGVDEPGREGEISPEKTEKALFNNQPGVRECKMMNADQGGGGEISPKMREKHS